MQAPLHPKRLAACLLGLGLAALGPGSAGLAQTVETRETELAGERCRPVQGAPTARLCPGHGGAMVELAPSGGEVRLSLVFSAKDRAEDLVRGRAFAKTMEWRGLKGNKGFEPFAALVAVEVTAPPGAKRAGRVFAVLRVDPREAEACPLAYVDASRTRNARALARRAADERALSHLCLSDPPAVIGADTPRIRRLLERPRSSPGPGAGGAATQQ